MRKIMITLPPELLDRLDQAVGELGTSRSQLIREVLGLYLEEKGQQKQRDRLEEGYRVHAARDVRISEAFVLLIMKRLYKAVPSF